MDRLFILWALPAGQTDRLYERPLTSMALTEAQADKVQRHATQDGWHGFRLVSETNDVPNFALNTITNRSN